MIRPHRRVGVPNGRTWRRIELPTSDAVPTVQYLRTVQCWAFCAVEAREIAAARECRPDHSGTIDVNTTWAETCLLLRHVRVKHRRHLVHLGYAGFWRIIANI